MQKHDIYERVLNFSARTIRFAEKLNKSFSGRIIAKQLVRCSTSIGANLQEADGAVSKKDFLNKIGISRKEAFESRYWLSLLVKAKIIGNPENKQELEKLSKEINEISKIICSIINNTIKNQQLSDI